MYELKKEYQHFTAPPEDSVGGSADPEGDDDMGLDDSDD